MSWKIHCRIVETEAQQTETSSSKAPSCSKGRKCQRQHCRLPTVSYRWSNLPLCALSTWRTVGQSQSYSGHGPIELKGSSEACVWAQMCTCMHLYAHVCACAMTWCGGAKDTSRLSLHTHGVCSDSAVLIPQARSIFSKDPLVSSQTVGPDEGLGSPPASGSRAI